MHLLVSTSSVGLLVCLREPKLTKNTEQSDVFVGFNLFCQSVTLVYLRESKLTKNSEQMLYLLVSATLSLLSVC